MDKKEIAQEILTLQEKTGSLNGNDYWKALYRIKELAGILAKHTLEDKTEARVNTAIHALRRINNGRHGEMSATEMAVCAWTALEQIKEKI